MLGMVHGAVLGWLGRAHVPPHAARPAWALAVSASVAAFVLAAAVAVWLALSVSLVRAGSLVGWAALTFVASIALIILVWATVLGWRTLEAAYARWPEHRLGTRLVLGSFGVILLVFLTLRPAIPRVGLRLPTFALIVVAALATLWIAAPAIIVALRFKHSRWRSARTESESPTDRPDKNR